MGNDYIVGGAGWDFLSGGPGRDIFVFTPKTAGDLDLIMDFTKGEDRISLMSFDGIESFEDLTISNVNNNLVIDLEEYGEGLIGLSDYTGDLDAPDFVIAQQV